MNRKEFMEELEKQLVHLSEEEREEALNYYQEYFEDAGAENEETVIRNLGSPEKLAKSILADLNKGEFTEKGYQMDGDSNPYQVVRAEEKQKTDENESSSAWTENKEDPNERNHSNNYNSNNYCSENDNRSSYQNADNQRNYRSDYDRRESKRPQKRGISTALLIVICIFAIPIALPLLLGVFGVFIGLGAAVFGLLVGFGGAGIACMVSGLIMVVAGITKVIIIPAVGFVIIGGGCLVFGIGLLLFMLAVSIAKLIPALCRAFVSICKAPFRGRSVTA